ncbi:MAG: septal ring lytic transglycosylase RlpA family protein [Flavobacterium sp.]|nr:MAG: septal ring lytic transglycosylase RlpA family protein [Flavobacterium sp.]
MKQKTAIFLLVGFISLFFCSAALHAQVAAKPKWMETPRDTINILSVPVDSVETLGALKFKLYKRKAHASYYHNKFNGKRTASGKKFDNNKYTAAHRKFPFGTKLRLTNEANGNCVIVEVTDRGPFSKGREIDLSRRAFMNLAANKNSGALDITIEVISR